MDFNQFKNQVKQNAVIVDNYWGNECFAINVQYIFDVATKNKFRKLQQSILHETGEHLLICPPETLHISIAFILAAKDNHGLEKEEIWQGIEKNCIKSLKKISWTQPVIKLYFHEIIATNQAVIVVANDTVEVNLLRETIKNYTPIPNETQNNSTIVHTTLFRYQSKLKNPGVFQDILDHLSTLITIKVDRYTLMKELRFPSIETEIIETLPFENHYI